MKTVKVLVFVFMASIIATNHLFPIIYGSVSGTVTDEETGKGVAEVSVFINGRTNSTVVTDKKGHFMAKLLKPGKYTMIFVPSFPHCNVTVPAQVYIEPGKNLIFDKVVKLGGSIRGKVLYSDSKKPFPEVSIHAFARFAGSENDTTKEDGSYFLGNGGRMCPSPNYYIEAKCNLPNVAYKILLGVIVKKGSETNAEDILFDLDDPTGIEGFITSSFDGKPLEKIQIAIFSSDKKYPGIDKDKDVEMGDVYTNSEGYYYIKNLDPGTYWIYILPPFECAKSDYEYTNLCKEINNIIVTEGKKTRVDAKLDIKFLKNSSYGEQND